MIDTLLQIDTHARHALVMEQTQGLPGMVNVATIVSQHVTKIRTIIIHGRIRTVANPHAYPDSQYP